MTGSTVQNFAEILGLEQTSVKGSVIILYLVYYISVPPAADLLTPGRRRYVKSYTRRRRHAYPIIQFDLLWWPSLVPHSRVGWAKPITEEHFHTFAKIPSWSFQETNLRCYVAQEVHTSIKSTEGAKLISPGQGFEIHYFRIIGFWIDGFVVFFPRLLDYQIQRRDLGSRGFLVFCRISGIWDSFCIRFENRDLGFRYPSGIIPHYWPCVSLETTFCQNGGCNQETARYTTSSTFLPMASFIFPAILLSLFK